MNDDNLRTRLTDLIYGTVSWRDVNVPVAEEVADAVIRELTDPIRGCTDPWHWATGKPYQCPSCGYWMGEGYV